MDTVTFKKKIEQKPSIEQKLIKHIIYPRVKQSVDLF